MIKYYCKDCKGPIIPYKTKSYTKAKTTYIYGTCNCQLEYDKYSNVVSSFHKRINITPYGTTIWNLKPAKRVVQ